MKEIQEYEKDIASIRTMMERSAKFLSLSGLSGVLAGLYALAGAGAAYYLIHYPLSPFEYRIYSIQEAGTLLNLIFIAAAVLFASISSVLFLSSQKAKKQGLSLWTTTSRRLVINMTIPLVTGGLFILILLNSGHFGLAAPGCLIFYGLALIMGSSNTVDEVRYLGFSF